MDLVRVRRSGLTAALVSSALATATLNGAPTANATCFSIFGIGNGNGCVSNATSYAIAIGEGATADASTGFFGGAFASGNNAHATTAWTAFTLANAVGNNSSASAMFSLFSFLGQFGTGSTAVIGGPNLAVGISNGLGTQATNIIGGFNIVGHIGPGTAAALGGTNLVLGYSGTSKPHNVGVTGLGNIVMQLGPGSTQAVGGLNLAIGASPWGSGAQTTLAGLLGTVALNIMGNGSAATQGFFGGAVNLFGTSSAQMAGIFATALNILGDGNTVSVLPGALLSVAFGLLSNDVTVTAGPGPLSFQGAILQNGMAVGQAIQAAIEDISSPMDGAKYAASQTLGDAWSAAVGGDLTSAFTTLNSLPREMLNAFLYGYDVDGAGPAAPVPGLLSSKDPDCTTQCHNGGPLYQLLVGIPKAIAAAIANLQTAAGNTDYADDDTATAALAAPETDDLSTPPADDSESAPDGEGETVDAGAVVEETGVEETVDESTVVEETEDETVDETAALDEADEDLAESDAEIDTDADVSDDADEQSDDDSSESSDAQDSDTDNGTAGDSDDSGSERAGKHRADGPRHAAK